MKVGIMTLALSPNYGAQLQSYALAKSFMDMGVEVEVYSYIDKKRMIFRMSFPRKIKYYIWRVFRKIIWGNKKEKKFKSFREQFVPMTTVKYKNNNDLKSNPGNYDIYIAGSDQIWNPDIFQYDLSYFLDFVPSGKKKVSYASSFAKKTFDSEYEEDCKRLLSEFDYISVREKSGIDIVKQLTGKQAEFVLDPTLLLNENKWRTVSDISSDKAKRFNGILCYVMPGDNAVTQEIEKIAEYICEITHLPIMRLGIKEYEAKNYKSEECDLDASPSDFVQYFMNSKYVITNSFHGTAFAVNFDKQILVPYNDSLDNEKALHERILSLLELLDAEDALWPISNKNYVIPDRNTKKSHDLLVKYRGKSLDYLRKCIEVNND